MARPESTKDRRPAPRLVVVETRERAAAAASAEPRRALETHRRVCHRCSEEEIFTYEPAATAAHVCGACEEEELFSRVDRSRLLHWWPILAMVVALAIVAYVSQFVAL